MNVHNILLLLLTSAAGCIDAVSYLVVGRVFTANMTGNTVLLGFAIVQANMEIIVRSGLALAGFLTGGVLAAMVHQPSVQALWPGSVTLTLSFELGVVSLWAGVWQFYQPAALMSEISALLVTLAAVAMDMQSVAVRRVAVSGVVTTYLTRTLIHLVMGSVESVLCLRTRQQEKDTTQRNAPSTMHNPLLFLAVWGAYLGGAVLAALTVEKQYTLIAFLFPIGVLALVVITAGCYAMRHTNKQNDSTYSLISK